MSFPNWSAWTPEAASAELTRALAASEQSVAKLEASPGTTYETLVWTLDDATRDLWRAWGMVSHMTNVMNSEAWRKLEEDYQPQVVAFSLRVGQSRALYDALKKLLTGGSVSNPVQRRILEKTVQSAELAGVALDGEKKARFNAIQADLARLSMEFSNAVLDATNAFKFEKDGKTYTIDDANYPETMKQCPDRDVREALCRARATRAPENSARIDEILKLRRERATLLGFAHPGDLSLATKCAPSVKAVFDMIHDLDTATMAPAAREAEALGTNLEPWDVAYEAERLRERLYAYSETELKRYFEFADVLTGLFKLTKFLFGVDIEEVTGADKPSVWHPNVRLFAVKEKGETLAHFYLDPYVRNGLKQGGAWMNEFTTRCDRRGEKPLAFIALNILPPDANGKTFLPFREVETLFHEFGHACQHMLTRIGEEGAAGLNLIEWDAVEIASQFMENWCLDDRTGIFVPDDLKKKVKAAKNFRAASACRRQLAFTAADMRLHTEDVASPNALKNDIFTHYGVPMVEGDIFLNAFTHIFAGGYAAGYYGYKWAEVMSADCYGAFEEAGLQNDAEMQRLGRAYRETILSLGGSLSAYEVFQKFRHRPPTITALLRQQGLAK